jgi:molecular chaperone HscC
LGIETSVQLGAGYQSGHYLPIIERNTVVPVSRSRNVSTLSDNQKVVRLGIYQGESRLVANNIFLGELEIPVPPRKAGEVTLDIRFTYDNNGLLEAQVHLPINDETHRLVIENNPGVLAPEEIAQRLAALEALKVHPRDQQINTLLLARLDRLYQESLGDGRERIAGLANHFQQMLDTQDERLIREARGDITQRLAHFEREG